MKIWKATNSHLGDCWAYINGILLDAENNDAYLDVTDLTSEKLELIKCITGLLEHSKKIHFVASNFEPSIIRTTPDYAAEMQKPFLPTRETWKSGDKKYDICYQFETSADSINYNPGKIFNEETKDMFLTYFKNYNTIELEMPQNLEERVTIMLNSKAFVGICSGMSIVAHSVNIPMFLKEYDLGVKKVEKWHYLDLFHANKYFASFHDFTEFKMKFEGYINRLSDYQKNNWKKSSIFRKGWSDRVPFL